MENAQQLGIGTMGFGGDVTLLGCKIGAHQPAAGLLLRLRRLQLLGLPPPRRRLDPQTGDITSWLYKTSNSAMKRRSR